MNLFYNLHIYADQHDALKEESFQMESNVVYETSMEIQGIMLALNLTSIVNSGYDYYCIHTCFHMTENGAYAALSVRQESFEMSESVCYAATEPRNLYTSVNISYGHLSGSGKPNVSSL